MKKSACLFLVIALLFALSACGPKEFDVTVRAENIHVDAQDVAIFDEDFEVTLTAEELYKLPQTVEVIIDGNVLDDEDYSYDPATGELEIHGDRITGEVEIKASAELISYDVITSSLNGMNIQGDAVAYPKQDYKVTLVAQEYYLLPEAIAVSVNGTALEEGDYTYDAATGELVITAGINGEVVITGEAAPVYYALDTEGVAGLTLSYETEEVPTQVAPAFGYSVTLIPEDGHKLPETVEVLVDGTVLDASAYTYDALTGQLTVPGASITADLQIQAGGVPLIVGKWKATIDMTQYLNDHMMASDPSMMAYFNFQNLNMVIYVTFNADCTGGAEIDAESVNTMLESMKSSMVAGMKVMLQEMLDAQGIPMNVDDYLIAAGLDLEAMFDESMNAEALGLDPVSAGGLYKVEGNKLFMSDQDGNFTEDEYILYSLKDGVLIFEEASSDSDGIGAYVLPMSLTLVEP